MKLKPFPTPLLNLLLKLFWLTFERKQVKKLIDIYTDDVSKVPVLFKAQLSLIGITDQLKHSASLKSLFDTAVVFRCNKSFVKQMVKYTFKTPYAIFIVLIPFLIPYLFFSTSLPISNYFIIYLIYAVAWILTILLVKGTLDFINNFEVRIGKALTKTIQLIFTLSLFSLGYFVLPMEEGIMKAVIGSLFIFGYVFFVMEIIDYLLSEILVDTYYYSKKIQMTEALVIESAFRLVLIDWGQAVRNKTSRQNALTEIERLAGLIERDWSSHILPSDEITNKWKIKTFMGIAEGIRALKRKVILPSPTTAQELHTAFKSIFEKIVKYDLQGLMGAEVPAVRIRKRSFFTMCRSFLVAVIPISLALCIKFYVPDMMDSAYVNIATIISGIWLLVCTLLWLDPNLADKIKMAHSVRGIFKPDRDDP